MGVDVVGEMIVCTRGEKSRPRCSVCDKPGATQLCDGPAPIGARRRTCDAPLHIECAHQPAGELDVDLCPRCRPRQTQMQLPGVAP